MPLLPKDILAAEARYQRKIFGYDGYGLHRKPKKFKPPKPKPAPPPKEPTPLPKPVVVGFDFVAFEKKMFQQMAVTLDKIFTETFTAFDVDVQLELDL